MHYRPQDQVSSKTQAQQGVPGSIYRASGRMPMPGWIWLIGLLGFAAIFGSLEALFYESRPFIAAIMTLALGLWLGFAGTFFVRWAHCRNRPIAFIAGLLAGILMLLTGFAIDQYRERPEQGFDAIPSYLMWRVETGLHFGFDDGSEEPQSLEGAMRFAMWVGFWSQIVGTLFLSTLLPWRILRTAPYCEACGAFMKRDLFALESGTAQAAIRAIRAGRLGQHLEERATPYSPGMAATLVGVNVCGELRSCGGDEGYASVLEADGTPNLAGPFHPSAEFLGRLPLELGRLTATDTQALRPKLGSTKDGEAFLSPSAFSGLLDHEDLEIERGSAPRKATILDIQDRTAGAVLDNPSVALTILMTFIPVLGIGGGLFLLAYVVDNPLFGALANPIAALIGAAMVILLITFLRDVHFFEGLLSYMQAKRSLRHRADRLVDPDHPQAFFVDVVPRANWGRTMAENASDIGFLRVEHETSRLLFEGDRQRYTIPAETLMALQITQLGHSVKNAGIETTQRQVLVLHVELAAKTIEIPFILRHSPLWKTLRYGGKGNFGRLFEAVDAILPEGEDAEGVAVEPLSDG